MSRPKINPQAIPRVEMDCLCRTFLEAIKQFYADPENQRRYEAWKQAQQSAGAKEGVQ